MKDCDEKEEKILGLSPWDFDQTNQGWRKYESSNPLYAARLIQQYIDANKARFAEFPVGERHIDITLFNFHLGQMLAFAGDEYYQQAIDAFKESYQAGQECWNAYVRATIGFLEGNIKEIDAALETIQKSEESDKRIGNIEIVNNFKLALAKKVANYKEVYFWSR